MPNKVQARASKMISVSSLQFSGASKQTSQPQLEQSPIRPLTAQVRETHRPASFGQPYFYLAPNTLIPLQADMKQDAFRRELSRIAPEKRNLIAHELGHLLVGHAAGVTAIGLALTPTATDNYHTAGHVQFENPPNNLKEALKDIVIRSAGLASSLQILSEKEAQDPEELAQLASSACQDAEDMYDLLQEAEEKGWLSSGNLQLPLLDFDSQKQTKDKMLQLKTKAGGITPNYLKETQTLHQHFSKELGRFFKFPVFQDAVTTAQQMIYCIPRQNQLTLYQYLARKEKLNRKQIQRLLQSNISCDTREEMASHLDNFVRKYNHKDGKALYEKSTPFQSTKVWEPLLNKQTSLYGTF